MRTILQIYCVKQIGPTNFFIIYTTHCLVAIFTYDSTI